MIEITKTFSVENSNIFAKFIAFFILKNIFDTMPCLYLIL